ncbi:MAG: SpoIIE family protein phosphatase [Hungatella sp.]|nr:SpoIIE family protein phosphatase [Hungatella sp.]
MAGSLEELAKTFDEESAAGKGLSREDGLAAMQMAGAMVCGDCNRCNLYSDSEKEDSYYLYYLLRAFEQKGIVDYEDMPRLFRETCKRQSDYVGQLNRNLGKATMNLTWKNRYLESRDAIVSQFRELAVILEEFSEQIEQVVDLTPTKERAVRKAFARHHMIVEHMLILEYDNNQKEAFLTVRTNHGRCVMAREAAQILGQAMGKELWTVAKNSKSIVTRQASTIRFLEEGAYQVLMGVAKTPKSGETVSGDNFTFCQNTPGQVVMSLSDGMGTGERAGRESQRVIELTEQLLEAGYMPRSALKLVNTVLLLAGEEQHPATIDLCCIDLYTGVLEIMKMGAAATFLIRDDGVEVLQACDVPAGMFHQVEPVLLSQKLWEDDRIVMVSDGVLDSLPGEDKERIMMEYLEGIIKRNPQNMADEILEFAEQFAEEVRDDMTVMVAGIWKKS